VFQSNAWIYVSLRSGELFQAEVENLGERVSQYACQNALEFASEVYAALRTGRLDFDDEVMSLYSQILALAGLAEGNL
jgi:hypothetical protein